MRSGFGVSALLFAMVGAITMWDVSNDPPRKKAQPIAQVPRNDIILKQGCVYLFHGTTWKAILFVLDLS